VGVTGPDFMPRLFDVDEPVAAPDGVVVEVMAASVNDFDRAAVEGHYVGSTGQLDPVLLGRDFVGRVTAVGNDVDYIDVGMYVAGAMPPRAPGQLGTFTDMVAFRRARLLPSLMASASRKPQVSAWPGSPRSTPSALGVATLGNLVIHGPVSEVGGFVLQLAKAHGAVVAAVTPAEEADLARRLGADVVIPDGANATQSIQAVRDLFGGGVHTAIHIAGDVSVVAGVLRQGGRYTSVSDTTTPATRSDINYVPTIVTPNGQKLADLLFKVAGLRLRCRARRTLSFDQFAEAVSPHCENSGGRTVFVR
jgi:NADPH:quinone reductase-like Zn-dependent oxidoreductase